MAKNRGVNKTCKYVFKRSLIHTFAVSMFHVLSVGTSRSAAGHVAWMSMTLSTKCSVDTLKQM